ncbi:hypothetical protein [Alteripontixanthobacter maritimus]|nr:hypothetical protein [Alteripontixanthobacter maritimus]
MLNAQTALMAAGMNGRQPSGLSAAPVRFGKSNPAGPAGWLASTIQNAQPGQAQDRWSLDSWLFVRQGSGGVGSAQAGPGMGAYGGSQAGAVLRYRLRPNSRFRPAFYARATSALGTAADFDDRIEAAGGLSLRPLPSLPLAAYAEARVSRIAGQTELRPAAFVVTELAPQSLPLGMTAETYGQAGYVGGAFATAFADGQVRVTGDAASFDLGKLRAGAGAWGGAQKGAYRIDIGPTAHLDMRLGGAAARIAASYRVRVAGDAVPDTGAAITLSTSF